MNYLKVALRVQNRYRGFTLINILGLSSGIVCSVIIFLYVNFHFRTDSFHQDADRIFRLVLNIHTPEGSIEYESGSALPMAQTLGNEFSQVERTAFCMKFYSTPTITFHHDGVEGKFKEESVAYADNHFLTMFTHRFITGDKFTALLNPRSVVLSEKQAFKYFGTVDVIGKSLNINNKTDLTITGVVAHQQENSDLQFDVMISLPTLKVINPNYQDQNYTWIGRNNWTFLKLKDESLAVDLNAQLPSFVSKYLGGDFRHWHLHLQPLSDMHFDTRYGGVVKQVILWVLTGVAIALILIVCVNYINLAMAQSQNRAKEIGIRKCLGSNRHQLFFQFMTETASVVFVSICIGLLLTYLLLPFVNSWMQIDLALMQLINIENFIYLLFFGLSLVLLAGYYPAVVLSDFNPLYVTTRSTGKRGGINHLLRKSLICFQYAIALLFLISSFIIVNQVDYLLRNDLGFSKDAIITVNLPRRDFSKLQKFRSEVANLSGVVKASLHHQAPMSSSTDGGFIKYDNRTDWEDFIVRDRWADDQFVPTYSLELIAGRNIVLRDSLTEILVNETLLKKLGIAEPDDILGKSMLFDNSAITGIVVGVVRDFHHRSLQSAIEPLAIYPLKNVFNQVGVKFSNHHHLPVESINGVWKSNFPDDVLEFSFLDQSIEKMYHIEKTTSKLMRVFAVVSIVICCMGILGLSVFSTLQRTKEIGIRKVLGATVVNIVLMLSKQYLTLIAIAFTIAIPLTYLVMDGWLKGFAYHITLSWVVFIVPALLMVILTLLLVGVQCLKTAMTNPAESLKQE
ncbi:MAG TPA: FtsX-like permease family protein [Ohtaekwangia sp.]|nr:FtsX-like permease family protein [Ohtaekwangia sp.]